MDKQIYGIVGSPVEHSLSPAMQNAAFRHLKIDAEYRLFEVSAGGLEQFLGLGSGVFVVEEGRVAGGEFPPEGRLEIRRRAPFFARGDT